MAEKIDPTDFQRVKNSGKAYISLTPGQRTMYLSMDYWRETGSPGMAAGAKNPFMDPRVRQAVLMAINVPAIKAKIFNGAAEVATQFTPHGVEGFDPNLKQSPTTSPVRRNYWPRPDIPRASRCGLMARTTATWRTAWWSRRSGDCWSRRGSR